MSVIKSKRGQGQLEVLTQARELATYTIKICTNEKSFPKRYRWCITNKIVENAVTINENINRANDIFVKNESDFLLRQRYQNMALAEIGALLANIDIAYRVFGVDSKRIKHWVGHIIEVRTLLRAWKRSDSKRINN